MLTTAVGAPTAFPLLSLSVGRPPARPSSEKKSCLLARFLFPSCAQNSVNPEGGVRETVRVQFRLRRQREKRSGRCLFARSSGSRSRCERGWELKSSSLPPYGEVERSTGWILLRCLFPGPNKKVGGRREKICMLSSPGK